LSKEVVKLDADEEMDIEADIQAELDSLKPGAAGERRLKMVTLDIPCVSFARTGRGIDPVSLVRRICQDASEHPMQMRSRYIKRMTPITLIRKTLSGGLEQLCDVVLKPYFHSGGPSKKFAIRPTIRNNNQLDRDTVIKTIASAVGQGHSVDLKNYDLLILVEVYRNICGMSVVGNEYEKLKRYNLAEIYQPTPKPVAKVTATEEKDQANSAVTTVTASNPEEISGARATVN
jgi:tRNA acetyltransferase TAN1